MTEWRIIERFPSYEISEDGEVRRSVQSRGAVAGKIIRWHLQTSTGYPDVRLRLAGKTYSMCVHRLMAETFLGPRPTGHQVRHLDGDKSNCKRGNLAYGTVVDNAQDKVRHGRSSCGEKNPKAKLTAEGAEAVRAAKASGESAKEIAARLGLNPSTVHRIATGKYWSQEASNRGMDRAAR